ncbi:YcgN family cysteine cluster protein [Halomonas shantousis]
MRERFWERYSLEELTQQEWEALCDGCGRCCLIKIEDEATGDIATLDVACQLLDIGSCRCSDYKRRFKRVPGCTQLSLDRIELFRWLPQTCAYRRLAEGRKLAHWHPLRSGGPDRMHRKGISVRSFAVSELHVPERDYEEHIIAILPIDE